jgi:hypothetical protein
MPTFFPEAVDEDDAGGDLVGARGFAAARFFADVFAGFAAGFAADFFAVFATGGARRAGAADFLAAGFLAGDFFAAGAAFFATGFLAFAARDFCFEVAIVLTIVLRRSRVIA